MNININNTATDITQVTVDGNTDIQTVNVDGTDVWFKAPTALEVVQALAVDPAGSSTSRSFTADKKFLRYHGQQQDNTSTLSLSDDVSISGLSAPITTSPYVTLVGMTNGTDTNGGGLLSQYYTPSGGSETGATENSAVTYSGSNAWMSIRTSYVNKSMSDITNYRITYTGASNDQPILRTQLVLPNKWNATTISSTGAGSHSLGSGEIIIICNMYGYYDNYLAANYVGNTVTPGSNSIILQNEAWWYYNNSIGIYVNNNTTSKTISWTNSGTTRVMKLTQQGI
jgi:hypothetical protein